MQSRIATHLVKSEAKKIIQQFCANHPLGNFATEILEEVSGFEVEMTEHDSALVQRRLVYRNVYQKFQTPFKDIEGEITVLLENGERVEMESVVANLVRLGKIKITPQFLPVSGGLHQAVMTSETKSSLLAELKKKL